jgi:nodulation protein E
MAPGRRVAVTGVGVVSALGPDREAFWHGLREGRSAIGPIRAVDTADLQFKNGAEIPSFEPRAHFDKRGADMLDRFAQLAVVAAREALADSGMRDGQAPPTQSAVVTGSCLGGQIAEEDGYMDLFARGRARMHPFSIPRAMANAGASAIAMEFGLRGPSFTLSTACSSANHALGQAAWLIRNGSAEVALAGGSEAPFCRGHLKAWEALRVVSPDTCRPFSRDRSGMVLGEGAGILVLEEWQRARARGARIYAELAGFGMSADAFHLTQPSPEGAALAMQAALEDAGLRPAEVGYVNAHGTATAANDPAEVKALRLAFGEHAVRLAVSSTKSMHGHALGAAGALEAVATVLALHEGTLPPTANFTAADPECDLDVIPNAARELAVEAAISNSFAFGGLNAVLAFRRADPR